mgnify:CR=1 FL=1|jgi:hypothetical protein
MSKRLSVLILSLLTVLVAFQVAEFWTAPQSPADFIKSSIAMRRVQDQVREAFDKGGDAAVEMMANQPVTEMGYSFTVSLTYGEDGVYSWTDAFVSLYGDPNEAYMATGRTFYDKKVLAEWNTPYEPPHQTLVSMTTALRTSNILLKRTAILRS